MFSPTVLKIIDLILITLLFQKKKKRKADVFKGLQGLFQFLACCKDEVGKENVEGMLREKRESKAFSRLFQLSLYFQYFQYIF